LYGLHWAGHFFVIEYAKNIYGIVVEKPPGKRPRKNMLGCELD
jgi:hypothetical protein